MALYHLNYELGKPERCTAMVSCPHGDIDTTHYATVEELKSETGNMGPSLAAFKLVRELSECLDRAEGQGAVANLPAVRSEVASVSYALGRLTGKVTDGDRVRLRENLHRLQEALLLALQPSSDTLPAETMIELVKATNLLAEVGSASNRI